jgi:hypothetical protein
MGGKPNKGTSKDMRLAANKPKPIKTPPIKKASGKKT